MIFSPKHVLLSSLITLAVAQDGPPLELGPVSVVFCFDLKVIFQIENISNHDSGNSASGTRTTAPVLRRQLSRALKPRIARTSTFPVFILAWISRTLMNTCTTSTCIQSRIVAGHLHLRWDHTAIIIANLLLTTTTRPTSIHGRALR